MNINQAVDVLQEVLERHDDHKSWCAAHSEGQFCCLDTKANLGSGIIVDNDVRQSIETLMEATHEVD